MEAYSGHKIKEIQRLYNSIEWAKKQGVLFEFLDFFLSEYKKQNDIMRSIEYANREWDLL